MSPAKKRKAAARSRRGGEQVQAKSRAAKRPARVAGQKASAATAVKCDMQASKLAAAFDRPEGAAPLLSHVPGCGACTTSLTVLAAAGQGLKHLTADGAGTAVERVLARGQAQGERKLADLVYELVKACLVVAQDVDRRLHLELRPRDGVAIRGEMRGVVARLSDRERSVVQGLPPAIQTIERSLDAADSCIRILSRIEGTSARHQLSSAVWLICSQRPADAEALLRTLLTTRLAPEPKLHACRNLQWALNRQQRFAESVEFGQQMIREFPDDWQLTYNLAVACAWHGDRKRFSSAARRLQEIGSASALGNGTRRQILQFEAPRFAEVLGLSSEEVLRKFGLRLPAAGQLHEVN